ncbi:MAG TPA: TetR/AcrR family transcriptional regulator [Caulobacter sp.]|nr:TetR/AcrR family transcriptional regulator [Caulobacter sp.]
MAVRDEQRERVIGDLAGHLLRTGLSQASLRQLAAAAGVSDRMLLYYFADKTEVLALALQTVAADMAAGLGQAIPEGTRLGSDAFMAATARHVVDGPFRPYMRLWIEIVAAAARNEPPFVDIAAGITGGFLDWIESRLDPALTPDPKGAAALILATLDGLALVDICSGPERALAAVAELERKSAG